MRSTAQIFLQKKGVKGRRLTVQSSHKGFSSGPLLVVLTAIGITCLPPAHGSDSKLEVSEEARNIANEILQKEPFDRLRKAKDFPNDQWSQADAYQWEEFERAKAASLATGAPLASIMVAIDDIVHLRARDGQIVGSGVRVRTPPLQPRLHY